MLEDLLRDSFIKVVDKQSTGWLLINRNFEIVYINEALCRLWQKDREELLGRSVLDLFYNGTKKIPAGHYHSPLLETIETGREFRGKEAYLCPSGANFPCWFTVDTYTFRDSQGIVQYALGTYTLIDRYKALETQLESINISIIKSFCKAIEARDAYTLRHNENVADLAVGLAEYLRLPTTDIMTVYLAGLVHDIGKIGVPESVLNKPGRLTDGEYAVIKHHPVIGADIVAEIDGFGAIAKIVRHHHERYDGRGYPDGLAGEQIPFFSRLLAVCDAYDAMTSVRCYRVPLNIESAVAEIAACAGSQFDPDIARCFIEYIRRFGGRQTVS